MSFGWTLLGTIGQLMLANLLFMLVVFSAGGIVTGNGLSRLEVKVLDLSMFALPGVCVLSALMVLFMHWRGGTAASYWWYAMPLAATALYLAYFTGLIRRTQHGR